MPASQVKLGRSTSSREAEFPVVALPGFSAGGPVKSGLFTAKIPAVRRECIAWPGPKSLMPGFTLI